MGHDQSLNQRVLLGGVPSRGTQTAEETSVKSKSKIDSLQSDPLADLLGEPINPICETELADLLGLTANPIRTLSLDAVLKRVAPATNDRREAVRAYSHALREVLTKKGDASKGGDAMEAQKLRYQTALADKAERENLCRISEVNLTAAKLKSGEFGGSAFPPSARLPKEGPKANNPYQPCSKRRKEDVTTQKLRYYLHGDQREDDPELWLCARCDAFVREVHFFEGHHSKEKLSDHERHLYEKKRFPNILKNSPGKWRRPTNPPNCLG